MLSLLLLAGFGVSTDFEGGSIGKVTVLSPTHLQCALVGQTDQDGRNRQANWYYFQLDRLPHQEITIDLVNLAGEYDYHGPVYSVDQNTRPVYSYDGKTWTHFRDGQVSWDEQTPLLRLRFTPERGSMWIAHVPPYTTKDLARLLDSFHASPYLKSEVVGRTVDGRDMPLLTVTNPATSAASKKVIWLMFRQHAWETGSSWACEGAIRFLLSDARRAAEIRDVAIFKIFPMADPDGVAHGTVRFNRNGYDLNRNWDTVDAQKMPEITAQRKAIFDWLDTGHRVDLFLSLHNTESGEYLECPRPFLALGQRLFALLRETSTFNPTVPLRTLDTAPMPPGRMNVAQGFFHDRQLPAMLMEQMVEYNSKLTRCPTVADRLEFGVALVRALAGAA